jgi:hypothetical protein
MKHFRSLLFCSLLVRLQLLALLILALCLWIAVAGHFTLAALCAWCFFACIPMLTQGDALGSNVATIKGDNTVLWGTASATGIAGIVVSARDQLTGEMLEISDEVGFTVALVLFNDRHECEVEVIVKTSYPAIARGDVVTIMGNESCVVLETEKMWEQKQVKKLRVKATQWQGMTP